MKENKQDNSVLNLSRKDSERYFNASHLQLVNWVYERTASSEKKARMSIFVEMNVDGFLNEFRELQNYAKDTFTSVEDGPVVLGNPSRTAINNIESLLKEKQFDVNNDGGEITVQNTDSVTGETIMTTIGIGEEDGHTIYFGEEKDAEGKVISRAVIDTGHRFETAQEDEAGYNYRLELHYGGNRYAEQGAEIDIDSASSPRATIKTLELLTKVVSKSLKE